MRVFGAAGAQHFGADQFDGGVARQETVLRAPDFAHPALAEPLDELIAAEILRLPQLFAEAVHHLERHHRDERRDVVRQVMEQCHVRRRAPAGPGGTDPGDERIHRRGRETGDQHPPRARSARSSRKIRMSTAVHDTIGMFGIVAAECRGVHDGDAERVRPP